MYHTFFYFKDGNDGNLIGNMIELTQVVNTKNGCGCGCDIEISEVLSAVEDLKYDIAYLLGKGKYMCIFSN